MGSPSGTASRAFLHRVCSFILIRAGRVGKIILVLGKVKFTGCLEFFKNWREEGFGRPPRIKIMRWLSTM